MGQTFLFVGLKKLLNILKQYQPLDKVVKAHTSLILKDGKSINIHRRKHYEF